MKIRKCKINKGCDNNYLGRCFECKEQFCYDHIWALQVKKGMLKNDKVRDICEKCKEKYKYTSL